MRNIKILTIALLLGVMLTVGQPGVTRASQTDISTIPPAITLVQDKENPMLVKHNFKFDNGNLVTAGEADIDTGFFVEIK